MTRILIIEDEASYRETLVFRLTKDGYDVQAAESGEEGLAMFARSEVDLVLLDLMLPGMDGTQVCRKIREHSAVPIIMLTAKSSEIDKVVGLEIGADDYVTKPYSYRELLARIRAVLRRREVDSADVPIRTEAPMAKLCRKRPSRMGCAYKRLGLGTDQAPTRRRSHDRIPSTRIPSSGEWPQPHCSSQQSSPSHRRPVMQSD